MSATNGNEVEKTVNDIAVMYFKSVSARVDGGQCTEGNLIRCKRYLGRFVELYGHQKLSECQRTDLVEFILNATTWKSTHSKTDALRVVLACFHWADEMGLIDRCPYHRPKELRLPLRPRRAIKPEEYAALMRITMERGLARYIRRRHGTYRDRTPPPSGWRNKLVRRWRCAREVRRVIFFLWRTGCRTCEMRNVRWDDIDWDAGVVRFRNHKTSLATGLDRIIGLEPCVFRFLRNLYRQRRLGQEFVFVNERGHRWIKDNFARRFRQFRRRAGLAEDVTAYAIRHGFTVNALESGVGERQIADQLGHTSTKWIAWYGRDTRKKSEYLCGVAAAAFAGRVRNVQLNGHAPKTPRALPPRREHTERLGTSPRPMLRNEPDTAFPAIPQIPLTMVLKRLLKFVWDKDAAPIGDVIRFVWGEDAQNKGRALNMAIHKLNRSLAQNGIPREYGQKRGCILQLARPDNRTNG